MKTWNEICLMSFDEVVSELRKNYLTEENIRNLAYTLWEKDGRPNGDNLINNSYVKVKDWHWTRAEMLLFLYAELDASFYTENAFNYLKG